jgi:integrase
VDTGTNHRSKGARKGEMLALTESDYESGRLRINKTLYRSRITSPKSKQGHRVIQLPQRTQRALEEHIEANDSKHLFTKPDGSLYTSSHFLRDTWYPLLRRADVAEKTLHTCRHYVCSTLISKGIPITEIARYVGDKPATLVSTYLHALPSDDQLIADALE